jgi:DNA-directed RNA polymerase specialized sigma24 family protein
MLNKDALEDLLRAFHADREQASHHYQALRERLIRFFQWNRTEMPEELADEVLDRLARRLNLSSEQIQDPVRYAVGIARLLLQEQRRKNLRREKALAELQQSSLDADRREQERILQQERAELLQQCLQSLPEQSRELIFRYYDVDEAADYRQHMARAYGISINALRNRALRIRMDLERQLARRLQKIDPPTR